jgi:hypothetical protein
VKCLKYFLSTFASLSLLTFTKWSVCHVHILQFIFNVDSFLLLAIQSDAYGKSLPTLFYVNFCLYYFGVDIKCCCLFFCVYFFSFVFMYYWMKTSYCCIFGSSSHAIFFLITFFHIIYFYKYLRATLLERFFTFWCFYILLLCNHVITKFQFVTKIIQFLILHL